MATVVVMIAVAGAISAWHKKRKARKENEGDDAEFRITVINKAEGSKFRKKTKFKYLINGQRQKKLKINPNQENCRFLIEEDLYQDFPIHFSQSDPNEKETDTVPLRCQEENRGPDRVITLDLDSEDLPNTLYYYGNYDKMGGKIKIGK